jgi:hypothetical protein
MKNRTRGLGRWFLAAGCLGVLVALTLTVLGTSHIVRPTVLLVLWPSSIAGIAVLKLVPHEELTMPKFVQAYLYMTRVAFSRPGMTVCPEDRRPDVTLFLLGYLHDKVTDPDLRTQIESTEKYVRDQTKAVPPAASTLAQPPPDQKQPPK